MNTNEWMFSIKEKINDKRINEIILPGTHNSCASKINFDKKFKVDNFWINKITNGCLGNSKFVKKMVNRWTLCQKSTIREQLDMGIRILDLRVAFKDKFYTTHTFLCQDLDDVFNDLLEFNKDNPYEVIVVTIKHDYYHNLNEQEENLLHDKIDEYFKNLMYPRQIRFPTYKEIVDAKKPFIFIMNKPKNEWSDRILNTGWVNVSKIKKIKKEIENLLKSYKKNRKLKGASYIITPDGNTILKGLFKFGPSSIEGFSEVLNDNLKNDIGIFSQYKDVLSHINLDFPDKEVINLIINENI